MRMVVGFAALAAGSCVSPTSPPVANMPLTLSAPGYIDFLTVDGATVWATNQSRVERWSRVGKLASVQMRKPCGTMALHDGFLWVADCEEMTVSKIDLRTAKVVAAVRTGIASPDGETNVVAGAGSIWVPSETSGKIARIDPATSRVIASVPVDSGTHYLAFGFNSLWAVSSSRHLLQRIDPRTNSVIGRIALGRQPGFLAAGEGAVWVQEQVDGTLVRVDPRTVKVTGRVKIGHNLKWGDIDTGGGGVWLRTTDDQTFVVVHPRTMAVLARIGKASGSGAVRHAGDGVWTSEHDVDTLSWWGFRPRS